MKQIYDNQRIKKCSEYHYQIKGSLCTVNFYPTKGTFYVNGATNKAFVCNLDLTKCDPKKITIEHKIPLSKGGSNRDDNLTVSCFECNQKRKNNLSKMEEVYI